MTSEIKIKELRLLPPLAFARFGSSDTPLENYALTPDPRSPSAHGEAQHDALGFRKIVAKPTLTVDKDGRVRLEPAGKTVRFKDEGGRVKPVAPFFELHAVIEGSDELVPVTIKLLAAARLDPSDVKWRVRVANRKVWRRTGDEGDIVEASVDLALDRAWQTKPSPRRPLEGRSRRKDRFIVGGFIPFGHVQCVVPNEQWDICSTIRLRFTPAEGRVHGPVTPMNGDPAYKEDAEHRYVTPLYTGADWPGWEKAAEEDRAKDAGRGVDNREHQTLPPDLFAIVPPAPPWLHGNKAVSRGYLDEACDGFVEAEIRDSTGQVHLAKARIGVAPPLFVPDAVFIRSLADDLEQIDQGPILRDPPSGEELLSRAEEVIRRATEAVRCMNVAVMNGNPVDGRSPLEFDTMPAEEAFDTERALRPIMGPHSVDTLAILELHRRVLAALRAGTAPWFLRFLRQPEEAGDLTDTGRRKMPALMCGADGFYLTLTRRQIDIIREAAGEPRANDAKLPPAPPPTLVRPRNRMAEIDFQADGNPANSRPVSAIANCCPGLEFDFRAVWKRLFDGIELMEYDNYVVRVDALLEDVTGQLRDLTHHRLMTVDGQPVVTRLTGPKVSDPKLTMPIRTEDNLEAVLTLEWSNNLAHILHRQGKHVICAFTKDPSPDPQMWRQADEPDYIRVALRVRHFFEDDSAVISESLAPEGTLTQGLCSPWQNDLRECSCYYWASSRPDFVNIRPGEDGLSHGDNWMQRERTGEYVPDSYSDPRLITYDDLFREWEKLLKFQIGGRDDDRQPPPPRSGPEAG